MKFKLKITQVYRVEREIVVDVEADDLESAIESVASGAVDTPDFKDPRWKDGWDLRNEDVAPAEPEETEPAEIGAVRILPDPGMESLDKIIAEQDVYYGRTPEAVQRLEARIASHVDTVFEPMRQRYTVSSKSFAEKGMGPDVEAAVKDFLYRNGLRAD